MKSIQAFGLDGKFIEIEVADEGVSYFPQQFIFVNPLVILGVYRHSGPHVSAPDEDCRACLFMKKQESDKFFEYQSHISLKGDNRPAGGVLLEICSNTGSEAENLFQGLSTSRDILTQQSVTVGFLLQNSQAV